MDPFMNSYRYSLKYFGLLAKYAINYVPTHEWASVIAKTVWVIKYTINYGTICEWASIFNKILWVINYSV